MKPDQHKQKKNAAYKKKHGIINDKQIDLKPGNQDSVPGWDRRGSKESPKKIELEHNRRGQQLPPKERSNNHQNSSSAAVSRPSNKEDHQEGVSSSAFSRRKIESNWKKYETDIDAEEETLKGADYVELLQSKSNVIPEFQFGRFNSVEEETSVCDSGCDWWEKHLSLDCDHLAAAFQCIPLPRRLDIDESLFERSLLKVFTQDADNHWEVYKCKYGGHGGRNVSQKTNVASGDVAGCHETGDLAAVEHEVAPSAVTEKSGNECEGKCNSETENYNSCQSERVLCSNVEVSVSPLSVESTAAHDVSRPRRTDVIFVNGTLGKDSLADRIVVPVKLKTGSSLHEKNIAQLENELESLLAL